MKKLAIYGAGVYGRRVFQCYKTLDKKVDFFIVSKKSEDVDSEIEGVPIYALLELSEDIFTDLTLIVAVNECHHLDIKNLLHDMHEEMSDCNILFYTKEDIDELCRKAYPLDKTNVFLRNTKPVSRVFGNDRGTPIDRYYIEKYLERESKKLSQYGVTLEVGEDTYSNRFFPNYEHDILNYSAGMDLTKRETIPQGKYDVFVCTQVFQQIYDVKSAIQGAYYLLKDRGIMLATVCGNITKIAKNEEYEHYWGFTKECIEKLVKDIFGDEVYVEIYGNCMAATAFIQGVSLEEVDKDLLDITDDEYIICISITARKNEGM